MHKLGCLVVCFASCFTTAAIAETPAESDGQGEFKSRIVRQTLTPVFNSVPSGAGSGIRGTVYSLSAAMTKGADRRVLTMEERWSNDVVVCNRIQTTGSRHKREVCRTRGEWQAMRTHAREVIGY